MFLTRDVKKYKTGKMKDVNPDPVYHPTCASQNRVEGNESFIEYMKSAAGSMRK